MYNGLRKIIQEVLLENKLFNRSQVEQISNRFKDNSEELKNQLAIFGLFRQQAPFNQIQDISQLQSKDQLVNLFNQWFNKTIYELTRTNEFIDNRNLATKYLKAYVANINSLGANARPFSMRNIEKEFVDVVLNNGWIKEEKQKPVGIYEPKDSDVVYKDDNIWIMNGNSRSRCILYGQGQKWCISNRDMNYYNTYRINYEATIYFCMQPNVQGDEHTFVILNYGNDQYGLADQTNEGERSGGPDVAMSWSEIEQEMPNLKGKKGYIKYKKVTSEEKRYDELVSKEYKEDDFGNYVYNITKNLVVHGSNISPEDFLRDYTSKHTIKGKQIMSLDDNLLNALIETGYSFLETYYKNRLSPAQTQRAIKIRVDSGRYVTPFEFQNATQDSKEKSIQTSIDKEFPIDSERWNSATEKQKIDYIKMRLRTNHMISLSDWEFDLLTQQQKINFIQKKLDDKRQNLTQNEFEAATQEQKIRVVTRFKDKRDDVFLRSYERKWRDENMNMSESLKNRMSTLAGL